MTRTIRTILVPLDGSQLAERALPHAQRVAWVSGAALMLIRAVHTRPGVDERLDRELAAIEDADAYLDQIATRLHTHGFTVRAQAIDATPADAIALAAQAEAADLIVMSTHGRSGVAHAVLGSVAEAVLPAVTQPLLLVPARSAPLPEPPGPFRRVLLPFDGSPLSESALAYVAQAPFTHEAELVLLHAEPPRDINAAMTEYLAPVYGAAFQPPADHDADNNEAAREALEAAGDLHLHGRSWQTVVMIGEPGPAIVRVAEDSAVDLIAMATHARSGLDRVVHGSVAVQVLRHAAAPLLLLRAEADATGARTAAGSETAAARISGTATSVR